MPSKKLAKFGKKVFSEGLEVVFALLGKGLVDFKETKTVTLSEMDNATALDKIYV